MARVTLLRTAATKAALHTTRMMVDKNDDWFTLTSMFSTFMTVTMLAFMVFVLTIIISPNDDLTVTLFPTVFFHVTATLITHSSFHLA